MLNVPLIHSGEWLKIPRAAPRVRGLGYGVHAVKALHAIVAGGPSIIVVAADGAAIRVGRKETCAKAKLVGGETLSQARKHGKDAYAHSWIGTRNHQMTAEQLTCRIIVTRGGQTDLDGISCILVEIGEGSKRRDFIQIGLERRDLVGVFDGAGGHA